MVLDTLKKKNRVLPTQYLSVTIMHGHVHFWYICRNTSPIHLLQILSCFYGYTWWFVGSRSIYECKRVIKLTTVLVVMTHSMSWIAFCLNWPQCSNDATVFLWDVFQDNIICCCCFVFFHRPTQLQPDKKLSQCYPVSVSYYL